MFGNLFVERPVVKCPYNNSHLISMSCIQKHILKCEKQYPQDYKVLCPYNATHRLSRDKAAEHIRNCYEERHLRSYCFRKLLRIKDFTNPCYVLTYPTCIKVELCMLAEWKREEFLNKSQAEITSGIECEENWYPDIDDSDTDNVLQTQSFQPMHGLDAVSSGDRSNMQNLPPPLSRSKVQVQDLDNTTIIDDVSLTSGMAMGRGKPFFPRGGKTRLATLQQEKCCRF